MKFVKLSVLALSLGMFIVSCGSGENTDTTETTEPVIEEQIAPEPLEPVAPEVIDTTVVPANPEAVPAP